ncbi:hypothetical protein CC86DRAFT_413322 [Ophiobolus disseminans]|uniref:Uncharacterized protein n=1 Tax=Ophiobolus disseminans TaxID=1469910 RepID=A0A6A6ZE04_9PLEO|nr:hypothetical protein CC86DRAFT_413322 [Ophiobolus disseminans]
MRSAYVFLLVAAFAGKVFALPVAEAAVEIESLQSPVHYRREADAEVERPRSPAPNVVKHNYQE